MNNDPQKNILLLLPPFYTPFTPPLGISILKAYLEQRGYSVTCYDFNTVPRLWVMHHKYFELLRKLEGITVYQGYTNLWYVLQAHMLAHLNGSDSSACARLLSIVLPIYGIKPESRVINSLTGIVSTFFRDLEEEISTCFDLRQFGVVGTSTYSTSLAASLFLHQTVKRRFPHIKTVMGGGVFADDLADGSANLETLLVEYPEVDHVVLGEGELLFHGLLEGSYENKRLLKISDAGRATLEMKDVPIPDYTDFNLNDYLHLCIEGARSCPFQCSFCSETIQWGEYRKKPLGSLAKQMAYLTERYGNNTFYMGDSLMNPYIEDLCGRLLSEQAGILYDGYLRADKIATHRDRVRRWARSGLVRARLGIESASRRVLDAMDKKTTPEGISEVLKSLANAGIRTTTLWIVGFPGETEQDFKDTLDFIREHHRFIYELDVHYYYYYPYGQVSSRLYQSYPLYPEEVRRAVKFQQWEIIDANPTREEKFHRLVRMNDLAMKLGIPNLHTLEQRYAAERRWQQLFPLARDVFDSTATRRSAVELRGESFPVFSEQRTTGSDTSLCYRVSGRKFLDECILAEAVRELVKHNELLQVGLRDGRYVAVPAADTDLLSVVQFSAGDLSTLVQRLITKAASELSPQRGNSLRVVLVEGDQETWELLFLAHRAIVDSRSVVLLVEDLFRIYEQLSENREVSLPTAEISYAEAANQIWEGRISRPFPGAFRNASEKCRVVKLENTLWSDAFEAVLKQQAWRRVDFVFGLLMATLGRASGIETLIVNTVCDYLFVDEKLKETVGPLTACYQTPFDFYQDEKLLVTVERARGSLKESVLANRQDETASEPPEILINLEYMLDEPWLGGDTWLPKGFVVDKSSDSALEIVPVQNVDNVEIFFKIKSEAMEALVDRVEALLTGETGILTELLDVAEDKPQVAEHFKLSKPVVSRFLSGRRKAISLAQ